MHSTIACHSYDTSVSSDHCIQANNMSIFLFIHSITLIPKPPIHHPCPYSSHTPFPFTPFSMFLLVHSHERSHLAISPSHFITRSFFNFWPLLKSYHAFSQSHILPRIPATTAYHGNVPTPFLLLVKPFNILTLTFSSKSTHSSEFTFLPPGSCFCWRDRFPTKNCWQICVLVQTSY